MWLLTFILILLLVFGYWYKYKCTDQIDKIIMNPTKQMLCLLLCVFLVFAFLIFIGSYALEDTEDISAIVRLYGLFSQTTSAYNLGDSTGLQLYYLFVSALGAVFFSGILVSTITNSILRRVEEYKIGKIHYNSLNKHDIIIGANEAIAAIVKSLAGNNNKIIIVSDKPANDVKKMLYRIDSKKVSKYIIIYNEHPLNEEIFNWLRVEKCNSITILGENTLSQNDSDNIMVLDSLINHVKSLNSKKQKQIKCYISYHDSYYITNYCRNEQTTSVNIIPFNFYAYWVNSMWGVSRLNAMLPTTQKEKKEEKNNYKPLMYGVGPNIQKHFVILGYSAFAEEIIKYILLNGHSPYYDESTGNGKTLITLISPKKECLDTMKYRFQLKDIADIGLEHLCFSEFSTESKNYIEKCADEYGQGLCIICCSKNTANNIFMVSGLPKCVYRKELQVLAMTDHSMPCNSPLNNQGKQLEHINFFGNLELNILAIVDAELKFAQAIRYIHRAKKNEDYKDCKAKAYNQWFGEGGISKQIDKPKMNILSRVSFLPVLFDLMGVEICSKENEECYSDIFPLDKFLPLFHRQQCAHNVLMGYTAVKKEDLNFKTKEIYHLLPYSEIKDCEEIVGSYKRFYKDIKTWLELNELGLKSCKNEAQNSHTRTK